MKKQFLNRRTQMFVIGALVWILLAAWTISAFWGHIDELAERYQFAARLGALASEVIGMGFLYWHCYDKSLTIRRCALIFSVILASILVFHAGALRGLRDARIQQAATEDRVAEKLTEMSAAQSKAIADASAANAGKLAQQGIRQRERLALANKANAQQGEIARAAQEKVAAEIAAGNDKVKDTAIVPRWYLDGWMYGVIFMAAMLMLGILWWKMSDADESVIDADYDGIPDWQQVAEERDRQRIAEAHRGREAWEFTQREAARLANQPAPSTDRNYRTMSKEDWERWQRGESPASKPHAVWQGGKRIDPGAPAVEPKDGRSH
ncbi:MAG: hypothetical protein ACREEM_04610 [Blastocatellia bacterium]